MIPASNNMKNTEWAVAIFKDFAIRSFDLQGRFQFGGNDEINSLMEEFPYMYVQANDIRVSPNLDGKSGYASMETTFQVTIADKLLSSKNNEIQTVSDSQEIMLAVISELSTHPYYVANQMKMVGDAVISTTYEADDAIVSRVTAEITLRYPFKYTYCNQPVDNIPFYPTITTDIFGSVTQSICTIIEGCPVIINIQNDIIDLQNQIDEFISTTKTLISGGAEWSGVGLTFSVSELTYTFNGPLLSAGPVDIQLNIGDPTYSRIDAIVVDEAGVISVIEGTPSPDPATPPIPDEQLLVQFVIVGAGATTPSITQEYIYLDNNEWTTTTYQTSGSLFGTVSFSSTIPVPFQGIYCINAQSDSRTGLRFTRFSNIDVSQYSILSLRIWLDAVILSTRSLQASLFLGTIQQGVTVNLNTLGLNRNLLNQWQQVLIPVASFGSVTNINRLQIRMVGGTNNVVIQYAADYIQLQTGIAPPQPQTQIVIQKNGSNVGSRPRINFIEGSGLSITAADDIVNDRVNLTLSVSGGGGSGSQGFTGPQGETGPQGFSGPQGETGPQGFSGPQGETGPQGFSGPQGNTGANGQSTSYYRYNARTNIQSGDPGNTNIIWNNITQISATQINISHINQDNIDIDIFLALIQTGNTLILQDANSSPNYQKFLVTGPITIITNDYVEVPVSLTTSGGQGTTNFNNGHNLILGLITQGAAGPQGITGPQGLTGPVEPITLNEIAFGTGAGLTSSPLFQVIPSAGSYNTISANSYKSSIIGGITNDITSSEESSIIGGDTNNIANSLSSGILISRKSKIDIYSSAVVVGGCRNYICSYSSYSSILGGQCNTIQITSIDSSIVGGCCNCLFDRSDNSSIIGGVENKLYYYGCKSSIIGGQKNQIYSSNSSSIIGGFENYIRGPHSNSSIIGGGANRLYQSDYSTIIGSRQSELINGSKYSSIISAHSATMSGSCNSVILGGQSNTLNGVCNSAIIGGQSLSLYNSDTVLVPNLWISGTVSPNNGVEFGTSGTFFIGSATFSICNGIITNIIQ